MTSLSASQKGLNREVSLYRITTSLISPEYLAQGAAPKCHNRKEVIKFEGHYSEVRLYKSETMLHCAARRIPFHKWIRAKANLQCCRKWERHCWNISNCNSCRGCQCISNGVQYRKSSVYTIIYSQIRRTSYTSVLCYELTRKAQQCTQHNIHYTRHLSKDTWYEE